MTTSDAVEFAIEDPGSIDARWCFEQYFAELDARFQAGFDPALSISADVHELTPPAGLLVIARMAGRPIGCGALKFHLGAPAELKRMWVAPDVRGIGLGRQLLDELERQARDLGVRTLRLETNRSLVEAIALYRNAGFVEVPAFNDEPYAHHWFEKQLPNQRLAMSSPFIFIATNRLKTGQLDRERKRVPGLVEFIEANEPRLIAFNEYVNEAGDEVTVVQIHPDAASMEAHMGIVRERALAAYAETLDATVRVQVFGQPTEAILEALRQQAGNGVEVTVNGEHLGGFTRSAAQS